MAWNNNNRICADVRCDGMSEFTSTLLWDGYTPCLKYIASPTITNIIISWQQRQPVALD